MLRRFVGRAVWSLAWLMLLLLVSGEKEPDCGDCTCKMLKVAGDSRVGMELNCSATGSDNSSVGRQVLLPNVDYGSLQVDYICGYFRRNNITKIQILNLELATKLFFDENNIDVVYDNAFNVVGKTLTELSLAHNKLSEIRLRFEYLKKLQVLDLSYNKITNLNFNDLNFKNALRTLLLASNQIAVITNSGVKDMPSLEVLDLSSNQLVNITKATFMKLSNLTTLNLSNNRLSSFQSNAFSGLTALRSLDLSHNSISTLDFTPVRTLKVLKIGYNSVANLSKLMRIFPNIQELHIEYNSIQSLSKSDRLQDLRVLNLSGNSLSEFQNQDFPELMELDLSANKLTTVPTGLNGKNMPSLQSLTLDANPLTSVEFSTAGAPFKNLRQLSLCHLEEVKALGEQAFPWLIDRTPGYKGLNLTVAHNPHLADVHKDALKYVQPLYQLDLSYNALTTLPVDLASWENITLVNLQGNPWNCLCSLQWMIDEVVSYTFEKGDRSLLVELRCASPSALRGRRFVHFYKWKTPAFCGGDEKFGRLKNADGVEEEVSSGSSEGMLIAVSLLGTVFLVLLIGGVVLHFRVKNRRRNKNRRL